MKSAALPRMPSQSSAIGIQAIGAMERSESTIGDSARLTTGESPITSPSRMPSAPPMTKPMATRCRLPSVASSSEPSPIARIAASATPVGPGTSPACGACRAPISHTSTSSARKQAATAARRQPVTPRPPRCPGSSA